ncbi:MAG: DUF3768 domain-containing protein [Allorhizobium sp.]|uniref:DUF3768 domain-containing protein n=1 Tax=Allorhizobium sp. TaxID=633478 RepID=UPI004033B36D
MIWSPCEFLRVGWRNNTYPTADLHRIYYDLDCEYGSEDPADATITTRVVTILLPEDY